MGLLSTGGRPLNWGEPAMDEAIPHVKVHGIEQLLNLYMARKNDINRPFLWGEEIETVLCVVDEGDENASSSSSSSSAAPPAPPASSSSSSSQKTTSTQQKNVRTTRLCMRAKEFVDYLSETDPETATWQPEYASYMVEVVPKDPYATTIADLAFVQENMQRRYDALFRAAAALQSKEKLARGQRIAPVTLVSFPLLGVPDNFIDGGEELKPMGKYAKSLFIPDECTNQTHPRFSFLTQNIRLRRGRKVCIQIPMFMDVNTLRDTVDKTYSVDWHPNNVHIDCTPELDKAKKNMRAFSSSDDEDDEDENDDADEKKAASKKQQEQQGQEGGVNTKATTTTTLVLTTTATTATGQQQQSQSQSQSQSQQQQHHHQHTFKNHFQHLFTPSTHYFYAQYVNLDTDREQHVKERFNACPCPTPVREHPCVYMDSMCFGMGLNCLQVTMQWQSIDEARHMYDQLVPVSALLLALSSATPFQKGILCDSDVRWLTISASVDCRKRDEVPRIIKSRYDNVSMYISNRTKNIDFYNDEHVEVNQVVLDQIKKHCCASIDKTLATHFAHLFIRDPLVIFEGQVDVDDKATSVHFENIQSTNWQSMRFKPPPHGNDSIGWRTELRTMDIQLSAFENAAFSAFSVLLARAIQKYNLFFTIPMSLVSANMGMAHLRDPVNTQRFWWRSRGCCGLSENDGAAPDLERDFARMSLNEIFNGCAKFEGFVPIVRRYLREEHPGLFHPTATTTGAGAGGSHMSPEASRVDAYIDLISQRASGKLKTAANFLREFVVAHPTYKRDSRLTKEIAHDIVVMAEKLARGDTAFEGFLPAELLLKAKCGGLRRERS